VKLKRTSAGHYVTEDGRYSIEYEEWWLEGECECLMCQQGSECPNGGAAKRSGWTIWAGGDHLTGEPFEFERFADARQHLEQHLAAAG
jgi:hypothetical protein